MQFTVNETAAGIVAPDKDKCKVKDCPNSRFKCKRPYPFCKKHSGLRTQVSKKKFKELQGNNELVIPSENRKAKGNGIKTEVVRDGKVVTVHVTSKRNKARVLRKQFLAS